MENSESCIGPLNNDTLNNGLVGSLASSTQSPSVGVIGGEGEGSKQPLRGGGTNVVKSPCGIETKGLKRKQPRCIMKKKASAMALEFPSMRLKNNLGVAQKKKTKASNQKGVAGKDKGKSTNSVLFQIVTVVGEIV